MYRFVIHLCRKLCSNALSINIGCSDHNLTLIQRKTKIPKSGQTIMVKLSFRHFNEVSFCADVDKINWQQVLWEKAVDKDMNVFNELIIPIMNKHPPLRCMAIRNNVSPWLDPELKEFMKQRDRLKFQAISFG